MTKKFCSILSEFKQNIIGRRQDSKARVAKSNPEKFTKRNAKTQWKYRLWLLQTIGYPLGPLTHSIANISTKCHIRVASNATTVNQNLLHHVQNWRQGQNYKWSPNPWCILPATSIKAAALNTTSALCAAPKGAYYLQFKYCWLLIQASRLHCWVSSETWRIFSVHALEVFVSSHSAFPHKPVALAALLEPSTSKTSYDYKNPSLH